MLTAALFFCTTGEYKAKAQELILPERWESPLKEVRPLFSQDTLTIRVLGDIMMHTAQISNARTADSEYDFSSYFHLIEDRIKEADISVANMEFTLAGEPYTGYPCFSAPDTLAAYLAECGFDVFLAANNHIFDKGAKGARRTLEIYRRLQLEKGIKYTGLADNEEELSNNNPLIIRSKGISIALLNLTYGTNMESGAKWPATNYIGEKEKAAKAFSSARKQGADFIIALPHWGPEYTLKHSRTQEETARWLAAHGADFIIGAHPHVVQDTSSIGNTPVVYSLGNAVSNMSAANTQLELMATIKIVRHCNGDLILLPLELEYLWCSRPGGFNDCYTIIPIAQYMGKPELWKSRYDYDKMMTTYERVRKGTE
jgi:poly-gamma-glutamate synthesis protein (capsule biosynthesis protein)